MAIPSVPVTPVVSGNPVQFVSVPDEGVPSAGVTSVGLVANTSDPVPVSSVTADAKLALDGVAKNVAMPAPKPLTPVVIGRSVALVKVTEEGVPRLGVVKVGDVDKTTLPVPVEVVVPVPPLATGKVPVVRADVDVAYTAPPEVNEVNPVPPFVVPNVPVTPVDSGNPVALVNVADEGVPRLGVTSVGDVSRTTLPVPVVAVEEAAVN